MDREHMKERREIVEQLLLVNKSTVVLYEPAQGDAHDRSPGLKKCRRNMDGRKLFCFLASHISPVILMWSSWH